MNSIIAISLWSMLLPPLLIIFGIIAILSFMIAIKEKLIKQNRNKHRKAEDESKRRKKPKDNRRLKKDTQKNHRQDCQSETLNTQSENESQHTTARTTTPSQQRVIKSPESVIVAHPPQTVKNDLLHEERIRTIGAKGERISNFSTLPITAYGKQLRNIYIPMPNGATTEIDTVIVTVSGIYVIETKNYNGRIYGDQRQSNWTIYYSGNRKHSFYNPIKQNETHIRALKAHLPEIKDTCFFSIIAFGNSSVFQNINYEKETVTITHHDELNMQFNKLLQENNGLISKETVNTAFEKLKQFSNATNDTRQAHINNINNTIRRYPN